MKISWGYKIAILYSAFVVLILYFVIRANMQTIDLVSPDYYEQELVYQKKIDMLRNAGKLTEDVSYKISGSHVEITLPQQFRNKSIKGNLKLYCPSSAKKDQLKPFTANDYIVDLNLGSAPKGYYEIQLQWESEGVSFMNEKKMIF